MTQQRARQTRALLIAGAAYEFTVHSYDAASTRRILEPISRTKGALYNHFSSKKDLAHAVLTEACQAYSQIARRWASVDVHPLDAIAGLVDDTAVAYTDNPVARAEARLTLEPEFGHLRPWREWEEITLNLAGAAYRSGYLTEGFTADKFVRVLAASLAGQRYLARIAPSTDRDTTTMRGRYAESLDTVLAAATDNTHRRCLGYRTGPTGR